MQYDHSPDILRLLTTWGEMKGDGIDYTKHIVYLCMLEMEVEPTAWPEGISVIGANYGVNDAEFHTFCVSATKLPDEIVDTFHLVYLSGQEHAPQGKDTHELA